MIAALFALGLAAVAPGAAPAFSSTVLPARAGRPAIVLAPRPGPRGALVVRFGVGSVDDTTADGPTPGVAHLSQLAMIHANRRLDALRTMKDVFATDGELAITTGLETCEFRVEAAAGDLDRLAERLLPALLDPAIEAGPAFEAVREKALHDRREGRGGDFVTQLARFTSPEAAYGWPSHGDRDALERLTAAQVRAHVARWFVPANATIVFAGAFDPRRAEALARRWAGGVRSGPRASEVRTPMAMMVPAGRVVYVVAFRREGLVPASAFLVAAILDERLARLRERGLTYAHGVDVHEDGWLPGITVVVPVEDDGGQAAVREVEAILAKLRTGAVTAEELARNRAHALARMEEIDRNPAALARELSVGLGAPSFGPARVAAFERLEAGEVAAAAGELLRDDRALHVLFDPSVPRATPLELPRPAAAEAP